MNAPNIKFLSIKYLRGYRFNLKRWAFVRNAVFNLVISLIAIAVGVIAIIWFVHNRTSTQRLDEMPECLSISEPRVVSPEKLATYFPADAFKNDEDPDMSEAHAKTFPASLMFMREPSFLALPECAKEAYRVLWLRVWHRSIAVRVWRSGDKAYLVAKKLDKEGNIKEVRYRMFTESEWATFKDYLERASYWSLPTDDGIEGNDGGHLILEGVRDGRYHVVARWAPHDEYEAACMYLINSSGIETTDER